MGYKLVFRYSSVYPCLQLRPHHLFTFVSCVHTKMQLRHAEQTYLGRFLRIE